MNSAQKMRLGIISALAEEQHGLIEAMKSPYKLIHGMREYTAGKLWEIDSVCVLSRIGKVAAAMTAAILVEKFQVTHIVFTGVAGSADSGVRVGDVVVAESLIQHDMDASPLFPRFEVPLTGISHLMSDRELSRRLHAATRQYLETEKLPSNIHRGLIGSGDQFMENPAKLAELKRRLPDLLAVEMEGAAVAQVCFELGVPFAVIRTISDDANEYAATDFMHFVKTVASRYAYGILKNFCHS
ncbi:5'-methylthioadenosine/adenosylhomocysteine nucleosidase [Pseudoduganella violacea]|uniref:adenosylhomocysteine nucleosidase n=1 Tax=Pseudoduganella violacea TaxID=1715466 RepID=A0A7W5B640_9BURK|nr:5'-methylthioadenosine/adenosylhomocysteine nucleosidase [Pseudoduganella violacea]MBB3117268.1 adenosylhomocysteine nucleosidase [Pseudoduganella violacea]